MTLPVIHQVINMVIRGKNYLVTCLDVFDADYGYYFDALFPRRRERCVVEGHSSSTKHNFSNELDAISYVRRQLK